MNLKWKTFVIAVALTLSGAASAGASTIVINDPLWYEFAFSASVGPAFGCPSCNDAPGIAQPTQASPWEFAFGPGGGTFDVTDAFVLGNRFEVFDFGVSLGLTSVPGGLAFNCGANPNTCFANTNASRRTFVLAAGNHSITIDLVQATPQNGAGYFRAIGAEPLPPTVPEPSTVTLVALGLAAAVGRKYCGRSTRVR